MMLEVFKCFDLTSYNWYGVVDCVLNYNYKQ